MTFLKKVVKSDLNRRIRKMSGGKECFIICPIGEEETPIRKRSDQLLRHIFEPVVNKCGYHAIRADKISKPGIQLDASHSRSART
jgi:hypothetical protein